MIIKNILSALNFSKKKPIAIRDEIYDSRKQEQQQEHAQEQLNGIKNDELFQKLAIDFEYAAKTPNQAPAVDWEQAINQKTLTKIHLKDNQHNNENGAYHGVYDVLTNENDIKSILHIDSSSISNYPTLRSFEEISVINLLENTAHSLSWPQKQSANEVLTGEMSTRIQNSVDFNSAPLKEFDNAVTLDTQILK